MTDLLWVPAMAALNRLRGSSIEIPGRWVYWIAGALLVTVGALYGVLDGIAVGLSFALWGALGWGAYMDMGTQDTRRPQPEAEDPVVDLLISPMESGPGRDFAGMALVSWRWLPLCIYFFGWGAFLAWPVLALAVASAYLASIRWTQQTVLGEWLAGAAIGVLFAAGLS